LFAKFARDAVHVGPCGSGAKYKKCHGANA
jgi:uncharacterized protein YchJ